MAKHDMKNEEVTLVANIPEDEYYREQIKSLEHRLDELHTKHEMALEYIETLEKDKLSLSDRIERLEKAFVDMAIR